MKSTQEGVIRFNLEFDEEAPMPPDRIREINAWRKILFQTGLIGKRPDRYGGFGYGNISRLLKPYDVPIHHKTFIITGTQTGDAADLTEYHYCTVVESDPGQNRIRARGPVRPSSESLTHAVVYDTEPNIRAVIHVHSPDIWKNAARLKLNVTRKDAACGTPEMADEVRRLFLETNVGSERILAMGGHEDGVLSFGAALEEAGLVLIRCLALAYQI